MSLPRFHPALLDRYTAQLRHTFRSDERLKLFKERVSAFRVARQFVAYYRVSTDRQGRSGLGLDAQREAVLRHLASHAGKLIGEFCEVESGRRADRPQLAAAIAA